jgi:predicted dinucleotide-binding enzyme
LIQLGHQVKMGSRKAGHEKALTWVAKNGAAASQGTFAECAHFGEMLINCTAGGGSIDALKSADLNDLNSKILIDIANPLDFSHGMPPTLSVCNTDSLGEQIQRTFPGLKVVKSLNTVNAAIMVNPGQLSAESVIFLSGNDAAAKATVAELLRSGFGWTAIVDLGDISTARVTEMLLPIWIRLMLVQGTPLFNFAIIR